MSGTYRAEGDRIDYTPDSAVSAGDIVVQNSLIGVATRDIDASVQGALAVEGVFDVDKEEIAFAVGEDVYYDEDSGLATASEGVYMGKCVKAALATDSTVRVKLIPLDAAASNTATGTI